ncbi:hypothetical protein [Streptodolium elevatio]|uniref:Uncharacterized protein n=1 Tax=Streptodolium elevatio TaxID=3157996 RepID=A0ABV3DKU8_9ACTN
MTEPRVIGIDLSLTATGWADNRLGLLHTDVITSEAQSGHLAQCRRMAGIVRALCSVVERGPVRPDLIVVEGPSYGSKGAGTWDRGGLWWLAYDSLHQYAPIAVVSPSQRMLYATGKGAASKEKVVDAVARRWPDIKTDADNNRVDAAVLALIGLDHLGHAPVAMPATHRAALDKVAWPALDPARSL